MAIEGYNSAILALSSPWPPTAKWCWAVTKLQVAVCILVHCACSIGPKFEAINQDELLLFESARKVLIVPFTLVALYGLSEVFSKMPREKPLVISWVVMFEFSVQISYYTLLSFGYGLPYQNQRCYDSRPIYATRWIGWSFGIPTLIFMNLYPLGNQKAIHVFGRLGPQMAASSAYCWSCFLGSVVCEPWIGWTLNSLGCIAYIIVVIDELVFVSDYILSPSTQMPALKGYSVIVKETMFVVYTGVWLMGLGNFASSYACQRFYTVSDISLKATMAFLLFLYWTCSEETETKKC